jgi:hypothetical protein
MPATPLAMKYEKAPAAPRPKMPPPGGIPHKVIDGDTWGSLAKKFGFSSVWDLIFFNFGTKDPREVNWYLREHIGCNVATPDKKNWRFTSSAWPGKIHIPAWMMPVTPAPVTPKLPPLPVPVAPFVLTYRALGVPHLYQGQTNLCWAHAAAMMLSWRRKQACSIEETMHHAGLGSLDQEEWLDLYHDNEGLSPSRQDAFATALGWRSESNACWTPLGWFEKLGSHGPLFLINRPERGFHAFVLTGIKAYDDTDASQAEYFVNDPAYPSPARLTGPQFDAVMERMGAEDGRLRIYHY